MKLGRTTKRIPVMVPIASIGDIAFLLIIFFIVTSNFMKERVPIQPARSADIAKHKDIMVSVIMDADGDVWLQGQPCPVEALEDGVLVALQSKADKQVKLKIDRRVEEKEFRPALLALSKTGAQIVLVGEAIKTPSGRN